MLDTQRVKVNQWGRGFAVLIQKVHAICVPIQRVAMHLDELQTSFMVSKLAELIKKNCVLFLSLLAGQPTLKKIQ
jgi:hypothetical protein